MGSHSKSDQNLDSQFSNVIQLDKYRSSRHTESYQKLLYISERGRWLRHLLSLETIKIHDVRDLELLRGALCNHCPDIIAMDCSLSWADANELARKLSNTIGVPIVMLCNRKTANNRKSIKNAYAAGVSDMLFAPFTKDELSEAVNVLIKFQKQSSSLR